MFKAVFEAATFWAEGAETVFGLLKQKRSKPAGVSLPSGVRVYAVGDIHGRADLLRKLLSNLERDMRQTGEAIQEFHVVFLGDYVDRGFESRQVIDTLLGYPWGHVQAVFLKGNHEETMLNFLQDPGLGRQWVEFGGRETLNAYSVGVPRQSEKVEEWEKASLQFRKKLPARHLSFLQSLKSYVVIGNCYFVHAGVDPEKPLNDQLDEDRFWIRDRFLTDRRKMEKIIVHGHTPEERPVWDGRRIGVDTGAYITNCLTAASIDNDCVRFLST